MLGARPMIFRNSLPTLVFTFLLYGGLYQMILRFLVLLWLPVVLGFLLWSLYGWPPSFNAFWYSGAALSNISSFEEISDKRLFIPSGMFLITAGGWFDSTLMYLRVLFGFEYGHRSPKLRICLLIRNTIISDKTNIREFVWEIVFRTICH